MPDLSARDRQMARRRARVRRLHGEGRSIRQIADILDCGRNTVERDPRALRQMKLLGEPERDAAGRFTPGPPLAGAEPGSERSSGAAFEPATSGYAPATQQVALTSLQAVSA